MLQKLKLLSSEHKESPLYSNKVLLSLIFLIAAGLLLANIRLFTPSDSLSSFLYSFWTRPAPPLPPLTFASLWFDHGVWGKAQPDFISGLFWSLVSGFLFWTRCFFLAAKYSNGRLARFVVASMGILSLAPGSLMLQLFFAKAMEVLSEAIDKVLCQNAMTVAAGANVLDSVSMGWILAVAAGAFLTLSLLLKALVLPKAFLQPGKNGLVISGGLWKGVFGEKNIVWQDIKKASIEGAKARRKLKLSLQDGYTYEFDLAQIVEQFDLSSLMSDIRTYAPQALDENCIVNEERKQTEYTELWLKYFTSSAARDRKDGLKAGERVGKGRYEIAGVLGQGGQGTAYLASAIELGGISSGVQGAEFESRASSEQSSIEQRAVCDSAATIVLKEYILPVHRGDAIFQQSVQKLQNEADILRKIEHPNIVELKDSFIEDYRGYLVLEFVDGQVLQQLVQSLGAQPESLIIDIALQLCAVLEYLHSFEPAIIHRDLTPDNLILQPNGQVKLFDFNVAHELESTKTASVVGKHAYIPPEQFRGKPSPQSDIFALGATLHFLLTGQEPEPLSVSHPRKLVESVSKELDAIVAKATALEQGERYASAYEMRNALLELGSKSGVSVSIKEKETQAG